MTLFGCEVVISESIVAPGEVVMIGPRNAVRWTPDGGVEELSPYQEACIRRGLTEHGHNAVE